MLDNRFILLECVCEKKWIGVCLMKTGQSLNRTKKKKTKMIGAKIDLVQLYCVSYDLQPRSYNKCLEMIFV